MLACFLPRCHYYLGEYNVITNRNDKIMTTRPKLWAFFSDTSWPQTVLNQYFISTFTFNQGLDKKAHWRTVTRGLPAFVIQL